MRHAEGGSGGEPTKIGMTDEAAATVRRRFKELSTAFSNTAEDMGTDYLDLLTGCVQFAGDIDGEATVFSVAWRNTFQLCGESAGLIAGNTNQMLVDLNRLDSSASNSITL